MTLECLITQSLGWVNWAGWFRELEKALILYQTVRMPMHDGGYKVLAEYDTTVSEGELRGCIKPAESVFSSHFEFAHRQAFRDMRDKAIHTPAMPLNTHGLVHLLLGKISVFGGHFVRSKTR